MSHGDMPLRKDRDAIATHVRENTHGWELPVSRQAIVKHLDVLRGAGLVESETRGREVVHRALGGRLNDLARQLEAIGSAWDARLAGIKRLAESG